MMMAARAGVNTAQLDLEDWALFKAHRGDPATSHDAARRARPLVSAHHNIILAALTAYGPLTGGEVSNVTRLDRYQVMRRMKELREKGVVVDSGVTRKTPTGRSAVVWRVV